jgi:superfamily I DNA and RNA helicase
LFSSGEFIHFQYFSDVEAQSEWVATQIEKDIKEGQLLPGDIMVINPIALTTKREVALIRLKLAQK